MLKIKIKTNIIIVKMDLYKRENLSSNNLLKNSMLNSKEFLNDAMTNIKVSI